MKYKKDFMEGYRKPSKTEIEQITSYYSKKQKMKMRIYYVLVLIFLFMACTLFVNATLDVSRNVWMFAIKIFVVMLLSYASWYFQIQGRRIQTFLAQVHKGSFLITTCKGYDIKDQMIRVHRGAVCLDKWFELDQNQLDFYKKDKDYPFKLMKMEFEFRNKKECITELFSNDQLERK